MGGGRVGAVHRRLQLTGVSFVLVLLELVFKGHWYDAYPFGVGVMIFGYLSVHVWVTHNED